MANILKCVQDENLRLLELLLQVPGTVSQQQLNHAFLQACMNGNPEVVQAFVKAKVDLNITNSNGTTPLMVSSERNQHKVVRILLDQNCHVNTRNASGSTALHYACQYANELCVNMLILAGANLNITDNSGRSPLIHATRICRSGYGCMQALVKAGANLDLQDSIGRSALHYACNQSSIISWCQLLVDAGANPDLQDADGNTPLMLATTEGFDSVIKVLIQHKANPDIVNHSQKRAVHILAMKNHWKSIDLIAEKGVDINTPDAQGNIPLWYAVNHNRPETVKSLLKANCLLEREDNIVSASQPEGGNPLRTALEKRLFGISKLLVLAGCDVTPLYTWLETVTQSNAPSEPETPPLFAPEDSSEEEEDTEMLEAIHWFSDWIHCPHSLQQMCRIFIRRCLGHRAHHKGKGLPVPTAIQDYITLKEVEDHHVSGFLM